MHLDRSESSETCSTSWYKCPLCSKIRLTSAPLKQQTPALDWTIDGPVDTPAETPLGAAELDGTEQEVAELRYATDHSLNDDLNNDLINEPDAHETRYAPALLS